MEEGQEAAKTLLLHRCASDVELYCQTFFPHYCRRDFNQFHRDLFSSFKFDERSVRRSRAAPRGSAKSTLATLIKPIHDVCYGLEKFIIIISNTEPLASQKLKDIRTEILTNFELQAAFGVGFSIKRPGETQFLINSDAGSCYFMAFGRGAQVRGARFGEWRPTKVICDDVEHSDEVQNERIRQKTNDWFFEDVVKVGDVGTNIEVVGTILHKQSLLSGIIKNPAYNGQVYRSINSWSERQDLWDQWASIYTNIDNQNRVEASEAFYNANKDQMLKGTSVLWESKENYLDLMKELVEIGRRAFWKEKQNEPLGANEAVFEKIHWYREIHTKEGRAFQVESTGKIIQFDKRKFETLGALDPSTGQTKPKQGKMGDYTCLLTGYKHTDGRLFVHEDWTKRVAPTVFIQAIFEHQEKFQYDRFGVETNLYRNLLTPNILDEKKRREAGKDEKITIAFYDIEQTENKAERIFRLEPKVNHGWILLNRALSETFRQQLDDFPQADHDDCPDALEMLWSMAHSDFRATGLRLNAMSR